MEINAFFPCEKAVPRRDGSIDILGFGIRRLRLRKKPDAERVEIIINFFCMVSFTAIESGNKALQIALISPDGETLSKSPIITMNIPEKQSTSDIAGEFPLIIKESGKHSLKLLINDRIESEWSIDFELIETES